MARKATEPKILRSIGFPLSVDEASQKMIDDEGGSINFHVIEAYKQYLKTKGYLK